MLVYSLCSTESHVLNLANTLQLQLGTSPLLNAHFVLNSAAARLTRYLVSILCVSCVILWYARLFHSAQWDSARLDSLLGNLRSHCSEDTHKKLGIDHASNCDVIEQDVIKQLSQYD